MSPLYGCPLYGVSVLERFHCTLRFISKFILAVIFNYRFPKSLGYDIFFELLKNLPLHPVLLKPAYCLRHLSQARPVTPALHMHWPIASFEHEVPNTEPVMLHAHARGKNQSTLPIINQRHQSMKNAIVHISKELMSSSNISKRSILLYLLHFLLEF